MKTKGDTHHANTAELHTNLTMMSAVTQLWPQNYTNGDQSLVILAIHTEA
jgi:hypothetical protein